MQFNTPGIDRYYFEYVFQQMVDMYSERLPNPITARQGRELRKQLEENILKQTGNRGFDQLQMRGGNYKDVTMFFKHADYLFRQYWDHEANGNYPSLIPALWTQQPDPQTGAVQPFRDPTVMKLSRDFAAAVAGNTDEITPMPISPYDPRWANREAVLAAGTQPLRLPSELVYQYGNDLRGLHALSGAGSPKATYEFEMVNADDFGRHGRAGMIETVNDSRNISALKPYLREKEFNDLTKASVMRGVQIPQDMLDNAVAIFEYLDNKGIEYQVQPGRDFGQVKLTVDDSKTEIRLLDIESPQYVGRAYNNGMVTYLLGYNGGRLDKNFMPNRQEILDLVRYSLGETVQHQVNPDQQVGAGPSDTYAHSGDGNTMGAWLNNRTKIYTKATDRKLGVEPYNDVEKAERDLRSFVDSARAAYLNNLDVEHLIAEFEEHSDDPDYQPEFSGNADIAQTQRLYWDMLVSEHEGNPLLVRDPGYDDEQYNDAADMASIGDSSQLEAMTTSARYATAADRIRAHANLTVDEVIGQFEPRDGDGKRFDAHMVASYMPSTRNRRSNRDTIIEAIKALEIAPEELRGNEYENKVIIDRMLEFDPDTAADMRTHEDAFFRDVSQTITESLQSSGIEPGEIMIDDNGVVRWTGERTIRQNASKSTGGRTIDTKEQMSGHIGQIFPRGERGEVVTKFAGTDNVMFIPGYLARVVGQEPGQNLSLEERTRFIGYEQLMHEAIRSELHNSVVGKGTERDGTTRLNRVYRQIYGHRYDVDHFEQMMEQVRDGSPEDIARMEDWIDVIADTEASRVLYGGEFRDEATMMAYENAMRRGIDPRNDNSRDALVRAGFRNLSIIDPEYSHGLFDKDMTGMARNHGLVRYLVDGATIDRDGVATRVLDANGNPDKDAKSKLMKHDYMRYSHIDPHDRFVMTLSNALQSMGVTGKDVNAAFSMIHGWNFEDGIPVSKKFAEKYLARDADGNFRALQSGDKISDFHGNKGVTAIVVDPDMPGELAEEQGIDQVVEFFKANPELDLVLHPASLVNRRNVGTVLEMMENPRPLNVPDGKGGFEVRENAMGNLNMIITHLSVDKKTNHYDEATLEDGKQGRKISSQLAWILDVNDCKTVLRELFSRNPSGMRRVRELGSILGVSFNDYAEVSHDLDLSDRTPFAMPSSEDLEDFLLTQNKEVIGYNKRQSRPIYSETEEGVIVGYKTTPSEQFAEKISRSGGVLELPFPITMHNGRETPLLREDPKTGEKVYGLVIPSSSVRAGQELRDGTVSEHDYTQHYVKIYDNLCELRVLEDHGNMTKKDIERYLGGKAKANIGPKGPTEEQLAQAIKAKKRDLMRQCQGEYDKVANDVAARHFDGKDNIVKEALMSFRIPNSATAVSQPDPTLDLDEIGISPEMAETLNVTEGETVLMFRDPQLHATNLAGGRVAIRPGVGGFTMSPAVACRFDGDFDGDTYGLIGDFSEASQEELRRNASITMNLLNMGAAPEDGKYKLGFETGLDVQVARHQGELTHNGEDYLDILRDEANEVYAALHAAHEDGDYRGFIEQYRNDRHVMESYGELATMDLVTMDPERLRNVAYEVAYAKNSQITTELSNCVRAAFSQDEEMLTLQFGDVNEFFTSFQRIIDTGAKGSPKKMKDFARQMGAEFNEETQMWERTCETFATDKEYVDSQYAMVAKDHYTGVAGKHSQHAVQFLRAQGRMEAATEVSYVATQGLLQAKHDAADARKRVYIVDEVLRWQWAGHALVKYNDPETNETRWRKDTYTTYDQSLGRNVTRVRQAEPGQWVEQMKGIIDELGASVDEKHIEAVADALSAEVRDADGVMRKRMLNTRPEFWHTWPEDKQPTVMDQLAYGGTTDRLYELAEKGVPLYQKETDYFMPDNVRHNVELREAKQEVEMLREQHPGITDEQLVESFKCDPRVVSGEAQMRNVEARDLRNGETRTRRFSAPSAIEPQVIANLPVNEQAHASAPVMTANSLTEMPKVELKVDKDMSVQDVAKGVVAGWEQEGARAMAGVGARRAQGEPQPYDPVLAIGDGDYVLPEMPSDYEDDVAEYGEPPLQFDASYDTPDEHSEINVSDMMQKQQREYEERRRNAPDNNGPDFS